MDLRFVSGVFRTGKGGIWSGHLPTCSCWPVLGSPGTAVHLRVPQFPYGPLGCV